MIQAPHNATLQPQAPEGTMHHRNLTAADLSLNMDLRAAWVAAGRPDEHEYLRRIATIQWDGPAVAVRTSVDSYTTVEVR
jgi:hypothetical protein